MKPDFEILNKYIEYGFTLLAVASDGGAFLNWRKNGNNNKENSKIKTTEELRTAIENGIQCFRFYPSERNLFVLDLDQHDEEKDGEKNFMAFLETQRTRTELSDKDKETLSWLLKGKAQIGVKTPHGLHIYFRAGDWLKYTVFESTICESVEVKAGADSKGGLKCVNACGSVKDGKPYLFVAEKAEDKKYFNFDYCDQLPYFILEKAMRPPEPPKKKFKNKKPISHSLAERIEWAAQYPDSKISRHWFAYYAGLKCGKRFTVEDILSALKASSLYQDLDARKPDRLYDKDLKQQIENGQNDSPY